MLSVYYNTTVPLLSEPKRQTNPNTEKSMRWCKPATQHLQKHIGKKFSEVHLALCKHHHNPLGDKGN